MTKSSMRGTVTSMPSTTLVSACRKATEKGPSGSVDEATAARIRELPPYVHVMGAPDVPTITRIVREGSAHEAVELATEARRLLAGAEFPQLAIAALTAGAEAAAAADERAEAERLLAEARRIAEAKGAVASVAQLAAVRVAG